MKKVLLECFLLSHNNNSSSKRFSLISIIVNKNNYLIFMHHFILFKLADCVKVCKQKLHRFNADLRYNSLNQFYEINLFNKHVLEMTFEMLQCFIEHLEMNKMEIVYFDWPISCVIWSFFDYFNFYQSLASFKVSFMSELILKLFQKLTKLVQLNAGSSARFRRLLQFLAVVKMNSYNYLTGNHQTTLLNDESLRVALMLNLADLMSSQKNLPDLSNISFLEEVDSCLKSYDFEKKETAQFILCYLSNFLAIEYKTKFEKNSTIFKESTISSVKENLKIFINKLLNMCSISGETKDLKELVCLCLSLIGPIDFQSFHMPIDKNEKYENFLGFPKDYNSICHYTMNISHERRTFVLQSFAAKSTIPHIFQFYYLAIEKLLECLISNE